MKVLKFDKNSEEMMEYRRGKSGGSQFSKLIPAVRITKEEAALALNQDGIEFNPKASAAEIVSMLLPEQIGRIKAQADKKDEFYKIIAGRVAREITPNDYEDRLNGQKFSMMARGHLLEPDAIAAFEKSTGIKANTDCVAWERDDNPNSYVLPDATIVENIESGVDIIVGFVEAKCPESWKMIKAWHENKLPDEYRPQVIKHFVVNEDAQYGYLVMYTDVIPSLPLLIFKVERKDVEDEITEYRVFEDEILKEVSELTERLAF